MDLPTSLGGAPPDVANSAAPAPSWTMAGRINGYSDVYDVISDRDAHRNLRDTLTDHKCDLNQE